ncbi:MAG: DNA adenine methylase [Oscillospiraceae bacterium]|nr:DNA adenine methylase [Oscillospiraceae bacterium]
MLTYIPHIFEYNMGICCKGLCTYCGGKARLYNYIAYLVYLCRAETFFDLFAGSAVTSLSINVRNKVINDMNTKLVVVYYALSRKDIAGLVMARIKDTKYCSKIFYEAHEYWKKRKDNVLADFSDQDICDGAYYAWILLNFSRIGSKIDSVFIDTKEQMYKFMRFQDNLISYLGRLDGALVKNESALDILENLVESQEKISDNTVIYLDPPYLPSKKRGVNSNGTYKDGKGSNVFGRESHKRMLELADKLPRDKCKVIISGYDDMYNLYDDTLGGNDFGEWSKIFVKSLPVMFGDGSKLKDGKRAVEDEYFFTNFIL